MPPTDADNPDTFEAAIDGFAVVSRAGRGRETLESLATEFAERTRKGSQPTIEEYARKYPHLAAEIREFFPTVAVLEQWKLDKESECLRRNVPTEFKLKRLGNCELVREIGRGGMGIVFEATDERSGQRVAVKVLPWRFGASVPRWRERFLKEAETVTRLRHDNIVPIYRIGDQDDYIYYVMQLVNGVSLDRVIQQLRGPATSTPPDRAQWVVRKRDWPAFAGIINQAASALCFAHVRGVLHNDVKPGNLLLDADRRVLVTDFGLARSLESKQAETGGRRPDVGGQPKAEGGRRKAESGGTPASLNSQLSAPSPLTTHHSPLTASGEGLSGTLRYMAPERFEIHADERSDVYSLGATLYELATLRPAFTEPDRQRLVELIANADFVPPADVVPDIPRPLETMVLKAMAADPADRYQSVAEFAADLIRFQNGQPIQARRPGGMWRRWRKWMSR
jgi:eukaryotic-like serine/threonine-protein kinase